MSDRVLGLKVYGFVFARTRLHHSFKISSSQKHKRPIKFLPRLQIVFLIGRDNEAIVYRAYLNSLDVHSIKQRVV